MKFIELNDRNEDLRMLPSKISAGRRDSDRWLRRWQPMYIFLNALNHYVDVDCFLVPLDNPDYWMCLHRAGRNATSSDLAYWISTAEKRYSFDQANLKRLGRTGRAFMARTGGFTNMLLPVIEEGRVEGALVVGPFADHELTAKELRQIWLAAEGRYDMAFSHDYHYFWRVLLEVPLLEGKTLAHFQEFCALLAAAIGGERELAPIERRMEDIFYQTLTRSFFHSSWAERVIHQHRYFQANWRDGAVTSWEQRELGISYIPQRVLALAPILDEAGDALEAKLMVLRFQRAALNFVSKRTDVAAGRLGDHGVLLFYASGSAGKEEPAAVLALAKEFQQFAYKAIRCRSFCGVGPRESKDRLYHSYMGAVDALQDATEKNQGLVQYSDKGATKSDLMDLTGLTRKLSASLLLGRRDESRSWMKSFISLAQRLCGDRLEALRVHFLYLGQALLKDAEQQGRVDGATARDISSHWSEFLGAPSHPGDLVRALYNCFEETALALEHPSAGSRDLRFLRARKWVEENYFKDPSLSTVAKAYGFSPSGLGRELKRAVGLSYSQWMDQLRLAKVQEMLSNTQLSASAIANSAGFGTVSYFFQWFKRQTKMSPGDWRRQHRKGAGMRQRGDDAGAA